MKDPYSTLGIKPTATDEEVKKAYRNLARKYHPDKYGDDNPLRDIAQEKMQEINAAYDEITRMRAAQKNGETYQGSSSSYSGPSDYYRARVLINKRRFREAASILSRIPTEERTAEWHYLTSVLLMSANRINDAMRELEMACQMDPSNEEYQRAKVAFNEAAGAYGSTYFDTAYNGGVRRDGCGNDAIDCCLRYLCCNMLCNCFCRH